MSEYTNEEIQIMSLSQIFGVLENRADNNECDGDCDQVTPFIKCNNCEAVSILNEIGEIMRNALRK